MQAQRPQPGNALQEGRDASIESEGLGNNSEAETNVLLFSSLLLLLRVLARENEGLGKSSEAEINVLLFSSLLFFFFCSAFWPVRLGFWPAGAALQKFRRATRGRAPHSGPWSCLQKNRRASRERACESIVNVFVRAG